MPRCVCQTLRPRQLARRMSRSYARRIERTRAGGSAMYRLTCARHAAPSIRLLDCTSTCHACVPPLRHTAKSSLLSLLRQFRYGMSTPMAAGIPNISAVASSTADAARDLADSTNDNDVLQRAYAAISTIMRNKHCCASMQRCSLPHYRAARTKQRRGHLHPLARQRWQQQRPNHETVRAASSMACVADTRTATALQ